MKEYTVKSYCIVFLLLSAFSLKAQINPETAFYWENPYYINPASVNLDYKAFFSLSARKQWTSFPGTPKTFFATGALYWEEYKTQAGIKLLKDKIGYVNTFDLSVSYAYTLRLAWNSFLNMGIAGVWQSQNVDRNEVMIEDPNDPILGSERFRGLKTWNAHLGMEYVYDKSLIVGVASQNLMSFLRDEPNIFGGVNYLYGRYRTRSLGRGFDAGRYRTRSFSRSYDMEYGVCLKQYESDFQVDGMVSLYINRNTQEERLQFSIFGRSVGEVGVLVGFKLISELKFLCTYDYNFKSMWGNTNGTFEVMVSYPIRPSSICRSQWDR